MTQKILILLTSFFAFTYANTSYVKEANTFSKEQNVSQINVTSFCHSLALNKKSSLYHSLLHSSETSRFYKDHCKSSSAHIWFDESLHYKAQAEDLLNSINHSFKHGLNPEKYHKSDLLLYQNVLENGTFESEEEKNDLVNEIDILMTDAYIALANDLYYGFTDWEKFKKIKLGEDLIEWERPKKKSLNVSHRLLTALRKNQISESLQSLQPDFKEYDRLVKLLEHYRKLDSNQQRNKIPSGPTIRINNSDERLPLIVQRLLQSGDLTHIENPHAKIYNDKNLIRSVKSFQARHNLRADGLIGKKTIHAMNISLRDKITSIVLSMERYRWLNPGMDRKEAYININVPAYSLQLFEKGDELFTMKVIVGKKDRPTPILSSKIAYAVLNPTWTAPETIVKEDILGKGNILEYLSSHSMRVYQHQDGEFVEIDPTSIDWEIYKEAGKAPFLFKADGGVSNPLGTLKFIFPNKYSIYMHDTNTRWLFQNEYRALSSGCVRLSDPQKLFTYLSPNLDNLTEAISEDHKVSLKKKIPIVIRYMTVGVDANQQVRFYEDIYNYDRLHMQTINKINLCDSDRLN